MTNQEQVAAWHVEWLEADEPHWGDHIAWISADEIARRLDMANMPSPESCMAPPLGWYCTRQAGHDGPCAAHRFRVKRG